MNYFINISLIMMLNYELTKVLIIHITFKLMKNVKFQF